MNDKKVWIIIGSILLILCLCGTAVAVAAGYSFWQSVQSSSDPVQEESGVSTAEPAEDTGEPVLPNVTPQPASGEALRTQADLQAAEIPSADSLALMERFAGYPDISPTVEPSPLYKVGDEMTFWASNHDTYQTFEVHAVLRAVVDTAYFWVEDGISYDQGDLEQLARAINDEIYPTNREFFGKEWSPGIDGDPHLYILYARDLGPDTAAYFSSIDSINPLAHPYSNAHEMFMVNADTTELNDEFTYGVLAHEFQHMIHWNNDRNEDTWVNEGFSELAAFLNGYDPGGFDYLFSLDPDIQLTDWPFDPNQRSAHYGSSFLFMTYFLDRFGDQATKALVANPANGMDSVDAVLADLEVKNIIDPGTGNADDLFTDWTVTNYLNNPEIADGRYAYYRYTNPPQVSDTELINDCNGDWQQRTVSQYGTDYIKVSCPGTVKLTFQGASEVDVLSQDAKSGNYAFWSNQSDDSNTSLSQTFDLTGVNGQVDFEYSVWYNLEEDFDYVYLMASVDGSRWDTLKPSECTVSNPNGNSYGCGYTGDSAGYIDQVVDLSRYAEESDAAVRLCNRCGHHRRRVPGG